MATRVVVFGATGMLATPIVRQLLADGFAVRATSRTPARASRLLPAGCEVVQANVSDEASMIRAMEGCDVVYANFAHPYSPRAFDPDLSGAKVIAAYAPKLGVKRIMRISTMGIPGGASTWWVAERKQAADDAFRASDTPHTILQPTWFMESLPLFILGRRIMVPEAPSDAIYWLAGADFARQVSRAIQSEASANRTYVMQGKYPISMKHAVIRFAAAFDPSLSLLRVSDRLLRGASVVSPRARYLRDLVAFTFDHAAGVHAQDALAELGEPRMTVEEYARGIRATGEVPKK